MLVEASMTVPDVVSIATDEVANVDLDAAILAKDSALYDRRAATTPPTGDHLGNPDWLVEIAVVACSEA
jgi:hypothetical protein